MHYLVTRALGPKMETFRGYGCLLINVTATYKKGRLSVNRPQCPLLQSYSNIRGHSGTNMAVNRTILVAIVALLSLTQVSKVLWAPSRAN
jgi:hypothetical protein